jgi:hypothetical protein
MGAQPDLYAMYDDPQVAFSPAGRAAGNVALSRMFGSPDASRAIANQAQQLSGISSAIRKGGANRSTALARARGRTD